MARFDCVDQLVLLNSNKNVDYLTRPLSWATQAQAETLNTHIIVSSSHTMPATHRDE